MDDPTSHTTPYPSFPNHVLVTVEKPRNACICNWLSCDEIRHKIETYAPHDDVWNQAVIRINENPLSTKITAFRACIAHHFRLDICAATATTYWVVRHHWLRSLLLDQPTAKLSTPITLKQVQEYDKKEGMSRHQEECNKVDSVMRKLKIQIPDKDYKYKHKFVRAPIVDEMSALAFANQLTSSRNKSTAERLTNFTRKPPSRVKSPNLCHASSSKMQWFDSTLQMETAQPLLPEVETFSLPPETLPLPSESSLGEPELGDTTLSLPEQQFESP